MSDLDLAIELLEQGMRAEAVKELERILSADIDNISAWRLLAQAVTDPQEVKECYEHVLRLDPHDREAAIALQEMGVEEADLTSDVPPFFHEDVEELGYQWQPEEPPREPGVDTAPLKMKDAYPVIEPPADALAQAEENHEALKRAEAALFDEEEEAPAVPEKQAPSGSILENDSFFYTAVVVILLILAVVVIYIFRQSIWEFIQANLPFLFNK